MQVAATNTRRILRASPSFGHQGVGLLSILLAMGDAKTEALSKVPLFAHCTRKELEFVASRADEVDAPAGRELVRQGRPGDTFYVLLDGETDVEVDGRRRPPL